MSTTEPLVLHLGLSRWNCYCEVEKYKSLYNNQIPAEIIEVGGDTLLPAIHKLISSVGNKEELPDQWRESIIVSIRKKGDTTDVSNYNGTSLLSISYKILSNILLSNSGSYINGIGARGNVIGWGIMV
jgi:hypothetical protein